MQLLDYDGQEVLGYTGDDDDMLDFSGNVANFAVEGGIDKQFTFTVTNAAVANRTAYLWAGYLLGNATLAPGQLVDGAFNDINGDVGLTGASNVEKTIAELKQFLLYNPTRLIGMIIKSDVANQIQNDIILQPLDPFRGTESFYIRPKTFVNQNTFQDKTVTFPVDNVSLDDQMTMKLSFLASSVTTITMFFGATLNQAKALRKKAKRAKKTMAKVSRKKVVAKSMKGSKFLGD